MKRVLILILMSVFCISTIVHANTINTQIINKNKTAKYNVTLSSKGNIKGYFKTKPFIGFSSGKTIKINKGTVLEITAISPDNASFDGWSGDCSSSTSTTCLINIDGPKTIFATFNTKEKNIDQTEFSKASSTCAIYALNKRDLSIINAIKKYNDDTIDLIETRNINQQKIFKSESEKILSTKSIISSSTVSQRQINRILSDAKNTAKSIYRTDMKSCGYDNNNIIDTED